MHSATLKKKRRRRRRRKTSLSVSTAAGRTNNGQLTK
jgi:hypothetical protein